VLRFTPPEGGSTFGHRPGISRYIVPRGMGFDRVARGRVVVTVIPLIGLDRTYGQRGRGRR